jgi:hypothetical protein
MMLADVSNTKGWHAIQDLYVFRPASLMRSATIIPAGPAPTTMTSHWVVNQFALLAVLAGRACTPDRAKNQAVAAYFMLCVDSTLVSKAVRSSLQIYQDVAGYWRALRPNSNRVSLMSMQSRISGNTRSLDHATHVSSAAGLKLTFKCTQIA